MQQGKEEKKSCLLKHVSEISKNDDIQKILENGWYDDHYNLMTSYWVQIAH